MIKRVLIFLMAMMFIVSAGIAQSSQSGALRGTVTDPDGVTLPGITVTLKSPRMVIEKMTTVTNAAGIYRFMALAPGEYELTFELEGMNTLVRKGITVSVGKTSTIDVGMTLKSLEESIIVSGKAPTVDRQKTAGVSSMDIEVLKMVPSQNRNFGDYFNLTPGVTDDTAHGSGEMDNSYNLDGVNMGDPSTGLDYVSFGMDIMEEIAVQTGGLSAEYGSVKGAVINVVTKSGGNKFSGSAYANYDHESLQSENTKGTDLYVEGGGGDKTGRKYQFEPGATLGGPIIKDKLWFFTNFNMLNKETYVPGFPHDKPENIPRDRKEVYPYVKFTLQPTQSDKFVLSYNFSNAKESNRGAAEWANEDTTVTQNTPTHVFNAHWTKTFGSNVYANLKLAYVRFTMNLDAKQPGSEYSDYFSSTSTGSAWRNEDHNRRDRYQLVADATTFIDDLAGSHEMKFGAEIQMAKTGWAVGIHPNNEYDLNYVVLAPEYFGGNHIYYGYHMESFDRKEDMFNYSFYLNDTWSVTNNLTINLGLRYDYNSVIWPVQANDTPPVFDPSLGYEVSKGIDSKMTPLKWNNLSPRLGLIYDIFSDGTTLLKASWAHYVQPNQTAWVNVAHPNGWHGWIEFLYGGEPFAYQSWASPSSTTVGHPNYDLKAPTSDEFTIGIEREMWEDWSLGLRYINKKEKDLIHVVDAANLDITALMDNEELNWIDWEELTATDPYDGGTITIWNDLNPGRAPEEYIVNPPNAKRRYDGIELVLNKRYSHGWSINASYVYANSRGLISTARGGQSLGTSSLFGDPNAHVNMDGRFPYERRHQIKLTGLVKGPFGINIGGYARYFSGNRFTRSIRNDFIGVDLNQPGTTSVFAEKRGSNGYPNYFQLDLKVEKEFRFGSVSFKAFADVFNVFNDNSIIEEYLTSGNPDRPYGEDIDIIDPRVVRFGVRIEF